MSQDREQWLSEHYGLSEADLAAYAENIATISKLEKRIEELEARLEITYCHVYDSETGDLVKTPLTEDEKRIFPDGISCRDATIALLEEDIGELNDTISRLRELVVEAGEVIEVLSVLATKDHESCDDEYEITVSAHDLWRAKAFRDKIKDMCHERSEQADTKGSGPAGLPTYQSSLSAEEFRNVVFHAWLRSMKGDGHEGNQEMFDEDWADWEAAPENRKRFKRIGGVMTDVEFILDILGVSYPRVQAGDGA